MKAQIPVYRAKKIDSDEYVEGFLCDYNNQTFNKISYYIFKDHNKMFYNKIDPTTLAINFPDMKDSEDNPIFASLSEDGKFIKHIKDFK